MKIIGAITVFALLVVFEMLLSGWTISVLWAWFVVTTFKTAALTIPQSIGLALIVSYLTKQYQNNKTEDNAADAFAKAFFLILFKAVFALSIGWVVTLFM